MNRLKHPLWWALGIFIVNLAIRLIHAEAYFMIGDEPFTVYFAQWPVADIYKIISAGNNPPTFEILLHYWMKLGGTSGLWLRLLPCLFISLAGVAIAFIANRIGGKRMLIASSLLFLFTNFQMDFAHTVRVYAMLICFSCWSMFFFLALSDRTSKGNAIGWIITTLLAIGGHYFGVFIVFAQWLSIIITKEKNKSFIKKFTIANGLLLLLFSPMLVVLVKRYFATIQEGTFMAPVINLKSFYEIGMFTFNKSEYLLMLLGLIFIISLVLFIRKKTQSIPLIILYSVLSVVCLLPLLSCFQLGHYIPEIPFINSIIWAIVSVSLSCIFIVYVIRTSRLSLGETTILLWGIGPIIFLWLCSFKIPMFLDRYVVHLLTAFSLIVPFIIFRLPKVVSYVAMSLVILLYAFNFNLKPERFSTAGDAEQKLRTMKRPNTAVILSPGYEDLRFAYHYDKDLFFNANEHRADTLGDGIVHEENSTLYKEGIRRALRRDNIHVANNIGMLEFSLDSINDVIHYDFNTFGCYPDNRIKETLESNFGKAIQVEVYPEGIYLYHYKRK